jgi:hypothetical protein
MGGSRLPLLLAIPVVLGAQTASYSFDEAQRFLKSHCQGCHQGASAAGGFAINQVATAETMRTQAERWNKVALRVRHGEMPPKGAPAPAVADREQFLAWADGSLRAAVCASGPVPGRTPARRLNRDEYAATVRDLLDIQTDLTSFLPSEGAGGEGFDNAGETLFLTPLHAEKYMDAARFAMDAAFKEFKPRAKILIANPPAGDAP